MTFEYFLRISNDEIDSICNTIDSDSVKEALHSFNINGQGASPWSLS